VKYFFLSDGWDVGRVWEFGGLWSEATWRRVPEIQRLSLCIWEHGEKLWLYRVEEAVIMVEVKPQKVTNSDSQSGQDKPAGSTPIGKVVLKRLITAEQAIEYINSTGITTGITLSP
jgi:hypothetical protein